MKLAAFTAAILAMGTAATGADHKKHDSGRLVLVCIQPAPGFPGALVRAAEMFARIGVPVKYLSAKHCPARALAVSMSMHTPASLHPGALAYAMPFERTHIVVFLDRVQAFPDTQRDWVLAHVLAHEIAHMLEGAPHHSDSGVMKAHWDEADFVSMCRRALPFAAEDVDLIQRGMEQATTESVQTSSLEMQAHGSAHPDQLNQPQPQGNPTPRAGNLRPPTPAHHAP